MGKLYFDLSLKYLQQHRLRSFLLMLSVVLGTLLIFTTTILNKGLIDSYRNMIDFLAGKSQVVVRGKTVSLEADIMKQVQGIKGVKDAIPSVQSFGRITFGKQAISTYVLGVSFPADQRVRDYRLLKGQLPKSEALEIMITDALAKRLNISLGAYLPLLTPGGLVQLRVGGIIDDSGIGRANGGAVAVMDIKSAQKIYSLPNRYTMVDFTLDKDYQTEAVIGSLKERLGDRVLVEQPAQRGADMERLLSSMSFQVNSLSFSALLVSGFLIFNTLKVAIKERRKEIGTLRALGLTRGQVVAWFLFETGLIAILGSIIGILLGYLSLGTMKATFLELFKYFVRIDELALNVTPFSILVTIGIGLGAALMGAILPVWEGAKTPPVEAMKNLNQYKDTPSRLIFYSGLVIIFVSGIFSLQPIKSKIQIGFAYLLVMGCTLIVPTLIRYGSPLVVKILDKVFGTYGRLAGDNLSLTASRTAITVSTLMIGATITIGMGGNVASMDRTLNYVLEQGFVGDITVRSASALMEQPSDVPIDNTLKEEFLKIKGIKEVAISRIINYNWKGEPIRIYAAEDKLQVMKYLEGELEVILARIKQGDGIVVSEALADRQNIKVGDYLTLATPKGEAQFEVCGIYTEMSSLKGAIAMSYQQFMDNWQDNKADSFTIRLDEGVDRETIKNLIIDKYAESHQLVVLTNEEYLREANKIIDDSNGLIYLLEIMTFAVAFIGVLNTLIISVLERMRELGILRAMGVLPGEIVKMVLIESGTIGFFGAFLGGGLGSLFAYFVFQTNRYMNGYYLMYTHPWSLIGALFLVSIGIAILAGYYPAVKGARLSIVKALSYE